MLLPAAELLCPKGLFAFTLERGDRYPHRLSDTGPLHASRRPRSRSGGRGQAEGGAAGRGIPARRSTASPVTGLFVVLEKVEVPERQTRPARRSKTETDSQGPHRRGQLLALGRGFARQDAIRFAAVSAALLIPVFLAPANRSGRSWQPSLQCVAGAIDPAGTGARIVDRAAMEQRAVRSAA